MSRSDHYGLLFGALIALCFAIVSMSVVGILRNHHSSALLSTFLVTIGTDYNVTVDNSQLISTTSLLQDEIAERAMNCSTINSEYVATNAQLDTLSVTTLNQALADTISLCLNRTQALEQLVMIVGMEMTPNLPVVVQSGTVSVSLDGSSGLSTTYTVNELTIADFKISYVLFPPWAGSIPLLVNPSGAVLRFNGFSPSLVNVGMCAGARPILVNRFDGLRFTGYELDCSVSGGEVRLYGDAVTVPGGDLELNVPLNLLGQFL